MPCTLLKAKVDGLFEACVWNGREARRPNEAVRVERARQRGVWNVRHDRAGRMCPQRGRLRHSPDVWNTENYQGDSGCCLWFFIFQQKDHNIIQHPLDRGMHGGLELGRSSFIWASTVDNWNRPWVTAALQSCR